MSSKLCSDCRYDKCKLSEHPCNKCFHHYSNPYKQYWTPKETQPEELTEMPSDVQYANHVYAIVSWECSDLDSIYEDYIIKLVGEWGLQALRENGLLEGCGYLNGRKLYVLCDK